MKKEITFTNETYLIQEIQAGNQKALQYLYKTHYAMIENLIRKNSGSEEDAQEIYQEAMLVVYEKLQKPDFKLSCSLKTYMYSVCRNMWMYQLRKIEQKQTRFSDFEQFIPVDEILTDGENPEYESILGEVMLLIDDKCRQLLELFYYHNLSLEIIAERLGYNNSNTAKSKKNKCMDKARDKAKELVEKFHQS
jgi:RNA polymerase sigma factor (sigma-70 family)